MSRGLNIKVPCAECLVKVRCMQRVKSINYDKYNIRYTFVELLRECSELREYFGVNTPYHMIKIKTGNYLTPWVMLIDEPRGQQLMESFLKAMHVKKMPTKNYPVKLRLK